MAHCSSIRGRDTDVIWLPDFVDFGNATWDNRTLYFNFYINPTDRKMYIVSDNPDDSGADKKPSTKLDGRVCLRTWMGGRGGAVQPNSCDGTAFPGVKSCCCCLDLGGGWWGGGNATCCFCKQWVFPQDLYIRQYLGGGFGEPGDEYKIVFNKSRYDIHIRSSANGSLRALPECDLEINTFPKVNQQLTFHWNDKHENCLSPESGRGCTTLNISVIKVSTKTVWNNPSETIYLYPDPETGLAILEGGGTTIDLSAKVSYTSIFGNGELNVPLKTNLGHNAVSNFDVRQLFPTKTGGTRTVTVTYPGDADFFGSSTSTKTFVFTNVVPTRIVWTNSSVLAVAKNKAKKNLIYDISKDENVADSYFGDLTPILSKRDYRAQQWVPFQIDETNLAIRDFNFVSDVAGPNTTFEPNQKFFLDALFNHIDGTRVIGVGEVPMPPEILSPDVKQGQVGQSFSYQIFATNGPTSYGAENLPNGLSIDASSGLIYGVPTERTSGRVIIVKATTEGGTSSKNVTLVILPAAPVINSASSAFGVVGRSFNYTILASNSPTSYSATNLPAGLSLNVSTGLIFGTPTTATNNHRVTVTATNEGGTSSPEVIVFDIYSTAPSITSPLQRINDSQGCSFSYSITATGVPGVTGYNATGLPPGLSIENRTAGTITGTLNEVGVYSGFLTAWKNNSVVASGFLPIEVIEKPNIISNLSRQNRLAVDSFSYQIAADRAVTNYTGYNLPFGVTIDATGRIYGIVPTGLSTISFGVSNVNNPSSSCNWSNASFQLLGWTRPSIISPSNLYQTINSGSTVNLPIVASSGTNVLNVTNLPSGLSFVYSAGSSSGRITGTAMAQGLFDNVNIAASNPFAGALNTTLTFDIFAIPTITNPAIYEDYSGRAVNFVITGANRPTGYGAANLPSGVTFTSDSARISGRFTHTGIFDSTLRAFNRAGTGIKNVRFIVLGAPVVASNNSIFARFGSNFSYNIPSTNKPTGFQLVGVLPDGLTFNSGLGLIQGSPSSVESKTFSVRAINPAGTGVGSFTINVENTVAITSDLNLNLISGKRVSYVATASNNPTGFALCNTSLANLKNCLGEIADGNFFNGLHFNKASASITGVPTGIESKRFLIRAFNRTSTANEYLNINIIRDKPTVSLSVVSGHMLPPSIIDPTNPIVGTIYDLTGNRINIRWSGTNNPTSGYITPNVSEMPGLSQACTRDSNNFVTSCSLSGIPSSSWSYLIDFVAENPAGGDKKTLEVNILKQINIPNQAMSGKTGTFFFNTVESLNEPVSFATNGTIPAGLSFNAQSGIFSGTPTATGNFTVNVVGFSKAASGRGSTGQYYGAGSGNVNFVILGGQAILPPEITGANTLNGYLGQTLTYRVGATNSPTGYSLSGYLPSNLMFYGGSTGLISGLATEEANSTVFIEAVNRSGVSPSHQLDINVYGRPSILIGSRTGSSIVFVEQLDSLNPLRIPVSVGQNIDLRFTGTNLSTGRSISGTLNSGLFFNVNSFSITGSGRTAGEERTVVLNAWNPAGTGSGILIIKTLTTGIPSITSSTTEKTGYLNSPFSYTITATQEPDRFSYVGDLMGLSFDNANGIINGEPSREGTSNITIRAANNNGTGSANLPIKVFGIPSIVGYPNSITMYSGVPIQNYASEVFVENNPTGYILNVNPSLNTGITFSSGNGRIGGTPTQTGSRTMTIKPINPAGTGSQWILNTTVFGAPSITGGLTGSININTSTFFSSNALASNNPTGFALIGTGAMFTGIIFNSVLGSLTGITTETGIKNFTVRALNPAGTGSASFTINSSLVVTRPTIASNTSVGGYINTNFIYDVPVGNNPTGSRINNGTLHPGLIYNSGNSSITGRTTTTGTRTIQIVVSNSAGSATGDLNVTMTGVPVITSPNAVTGVLNSLFNYNIIATNEPTSYGYASNSFLPAGLILQGNDIVGIPTQTGIYPVRIAAYNPAGSGILDLSIRINPAGQVPRILYPSDGDYISADLGVPQDIAFIAANSPTGWDIQGPLPNGLVFNRARGTITGTTNSEACVPFYLTLTARNAFGSSTPVSFNLLPYIPECG